MALRSDPLAAQSILDQLDDFRKTGAWQEMVEFTDKLVQYIDGRRQRSSPLLKWYNVRFATRFSKRARIASLQR
eukprot:CAMPEP_0202470060 /NCGR_PEP_ID=MMETSP1360-20130828/80362_1 /ASSEMBLY_ACC=CAM_ASM_000848 /TAXON_ID=515479 /ORGANISM="Licmophora paradoxa, Strain CCMP2313" /LENGTH=73 /DNA_ID=CAMNT_0049095619 /DNA_START=33 /DNA_END=251 /DNA_ORIENTATION=+